MSAAEPTLPPEADNANSRRFSAQVDFARFMALADGSELYGFLKKFTGEPSAAREAVRAHAEDVYAHAQLVRAGMVPHSSLLAKRTETLVYSLATLMAESKVELSDEQHFYGAAEKLAEGFAVWAGQQKENGLKR